MCRNEQLNQNILTCLKTINSGFSSRFSTIGYLYLTIESKKEREEKNKSIFEHVTTHPQGNGNKRKQ